ncbi:MAG: flagellar hook-basal body complex protein [bacterium]|nr:flagellar hook-basal body complex protein [bacterium]
MFQALYAGISGLNSYQTWLEVIGNNISNAQTIGFKKSRVTFEELFNQTLKSAFSPRNGRGGENPKQIGMGVTNATIQVLHTQGGINDTEKDTDLAIQGEGFFILKEIECHLEHFTRAGSFDFDSDGNLVNPGNGFFVQGWMAERNPENGQLKIDPKTLKSIVYTDKPLENIRVDFGEILAPKVTDNLKLTGNLSSDQPIPISPIEIGFTASAKSTEEVVSRNYGFTEDGRFVYEDDFGFWWHSDNTLARKPDLVRSALDISRDWKTAGFERIPTGSISINGATFVLSDYATVKDFIQAVNESQKANVTISYDETEDKWTIEQDILGDDLRLEEMPSETSPIGFFTECKIPVGEIKGKDIRIVFKHLFEPQNPDNLYFRFTPIDPETYDPETPRIMSTSEVQYGGGVLDLTKKPTEAFQEDNPDGTITINDYTSRPLSQYESLNSLIHEINNSELAGVVISYDPRIDRFTISNKVPGRHLTIHEEKVPDLEGAKIKGCLMDRMSGEGYIDGKVLGQIDGTIKNNATAIGTVKGMTLGQYAIGKLTGHTIGEVHEARIEGRGMLSGSVVIFTGKIKGDVTSTDTGETPQLISYINGIVSGSSIGTINNASFSAKVQSHTFHLIGDIDGYLEAGGKVTGQIIGSATGTVDTTKVTGGHVQGQAGLESDGVRWSNFYNIIPAGGGDGDNNWVDPPTLATINGKIIGSAIGTINATITGRYWDRATGTPNTGTNVMLNGDFIVTGTIEGLVTGYARGDITGIINGPVTGTPITGTTAIIKGEVDGDWRGEVNVNGEVFNRPGPVGATDYINAAVKASGNLIGSAYGTVSGEVLGRGAQTDQDYQGAHGEISGKIKHSEVNAWEFSGKGYVDANIKIEGEITGSINSASTTAADEGTKGSNVGAIIRSLIASSFQNTGTIEGEVRLRGGDQKILGYFDGEVNAIYGSYGILDDYAILGRIVGEVQGYGDIEGKYEGYTSAIGTFDGSLDGTISTDPWNVARFVGSAVGTISGEIKGLVKGYVEGVYVEHEMDFIGTVIGSVKGRVEYNPRTGREIISGRAYGKGEGRFIGQIDAEPRRIPGFFTRIHMKTGTKSATSGILQLEGDIKGLNYGKVKNCFIDTDINSKTAIHKANDVLDITEEIPDPKRDDWIYKTQDGRDFFTINIAGNDVAIFIPNGQITGEEPIKFTPNLGDEINGDLITPIIKAGTGSPVIAELRSQEQYEYNISESVYDSLGNSFPLNFTFERLDTNYWLWYVKNPVEEGKISGYGLIRFDANGEYNGFISEIFQSPSDPKTFDEDSGIRRGKTIGFQGIYLDPPDTPYPKDYNGSPPSGYGANRLEIDIDLSDLTQFSQHANDVEIDQDGYPKGILKGVRFDTQGFLIGEYSNKKHLPLAQIALARFKNPSGLIKEDATMFRESANSGEAEIGSASEECFGDIISRGLEMSNVDITAEFVNMVLAERSFQISSRTITTWDRMLMEIMRLRM